LCRYPRSSEYHNQYGNKATNPVDRLDKTQTLPPVPKSQDELKSASMSYLIMNLLINVIGKEPLKQVSICLATLVTSLMNQRLMKIWSMVSELKKEQLGWSRILQNISNKYIFWNEWINVLLLKPHSYSWICWPQTKMRIER